MDVKITFTVIRNDIYVGIYTNDYHIEEFNLNEVKSLLKTEFRKSKNDFIDIHILGIYPIYPPSNPQ